MAYINGNEVLDAIIVRNTGGGGEIPDGAVTAAKLADSAVTTEKIADEAVTLDKIDPAAITPVYDWANFVGEGNVIKTNIPIESTDKVHLKFKYLGGNSNTCIIGHDGDSSVGRFALTSGTGGYFTYAQQTNIHALDNNEHTFEINGNTNEITFDNNTWGTFAIAQYGNYTIGYRQYLSNPNVAIKRFTVTDVNSNKKLDFFPTKILGVIPCMYEAVSGKLYYEPISIYNEEV